MAMRVGLDEWSIHHLDISAYDKLDLLDRLGLEGIQFADARHLSPTLDHGEIREVAEEARCRNLYMEMGMPGLDVLRSESVLRAGKGNLIEGYHTLMKACAATGSNIIRTFVGGPGDRLSQWRFQLEGATKLAQILSPVARELGVYLAFETHADVTSFELLRLIEEVGEDVARVCLDTGNLPIGLEDSLAATRRLAPYVVATHMKDCIVFFNESGLAVQARPIGTGILPVRDIVDTLMAVNPQMNLSIEDHEGLYPVDLSDGWQLFYPDLQAEEVVSTFRRAKECEQRIANKEMADPLHLEEIPWMDQAEERILSGAAYLKPIIEEAKA
jgi:sugar phosphate isomerase/epimerase